MVCPVALLLINVTTTTTQTTTPLVTQLATPLATPLATQLATAPLTVLLRTEIGHPPDNYGEYVMGSTDKDPQFGMFYGNDPSAAAHSWGERDIIGGAGVPITLTTEGLPYPFTETLWEIIGVHDRKSANYGKTIWNRLWNTY